MKAVERDRRDKYEIIAKYYDQAYVAKPSLVDLPFYVDLAKQSGGPVLELGCGTGRILMPIAREGVSIDGIDASSSMLSVLEEKLSEESEALRSRVSVNCADMRSYRSEKKYPLVIIPFRIMQHMYSLDDQLQALDTASRLIGGDGLLAFDVFNPHFDKVFAGIGEEVFDFEWSEGEYVIKRFFRKDSVDKINLSFAGVFIFRKYREEELISEEEDGIEMSFYTYPHLLALFELAGLEVVESYGSFNKEPLKDGSPEMIFLLRNKEK